MITRRQAQLSVLAVVLVACSSTGGSLPSNNAPPVCNEVIAYARRCNLPPCQVNDLQSQCPALAANYRPEALAAFSACNNATQACPTDGGTSNPMTSNCVNTMLYSVTPSAVQRETAMALCARCPAIAGGGMGATPESCAAAVFMPPRAGSSGGIGSLLLAFNDEVIGRIRTSCGMGSADAGSFCQLDVIFCALAATGVNLRSSCPPDGGR